jgi:hypothetical protein
VTDLSTLLARVEAGSGADRELDAEIATTLGGFVREKRGRDQKSWLYHPTAPRRDGMWGAYFYTTDLNAVIALVEARLPGACWRIEKLSDAMKFGNRDLPDFWATCGLAGEQEQAYAPTPARALLAALLRAEMEKQT